MLLKVIKIKNVMSHFWFFNHGFKYQNSVCNGCHDLTMLYHNISDVTVITVKGIYFYYRCIEYRCIHDIRKSDTINLLDNLVTDNRWYI